jgi:hypothetical protein
MSRKSWLRPTALWPQSLRTQKFFSLTHIITMTCIRNMHSLIGSRTFTLPMHEQQFMFFSAKDVKNGVMDDRIKSVKIKQWQKHDDDDCTLFHFSSKLRKSHGIKKLFNDACISTLIDTPRIGILARLNEVLYNIGLLTPSTRKSIKNSFPQPKFDCAKKNQSNVLLTW